MTQGMIDQHQRQYGFGNRCGADADARIVAAGGLHLHRVAGLVDRIALLRDAGSRFEGDIDFDILAGGNTAENAAGFVAAETVREHLVAMHWKPLRHRSETGADFHPLAALMFIIA